ncbi:MAG: hypothetical protein GC134_04925 [Proteobacteria bacterium]|nr:hypothetical protein [Pseudomonadota bacterium]
MFKLLLPVIVIAALVIFFAKLVSGSDDTPTEAETAPLPPRPGASKGQAVIVTITMLATLFFAYLFGKDITPVAWVLKNPLITIPSYLFIGLFWMFGEWIGRGMGNAAKLRELKAEFFAIHKLGDDIGKPVPAELRKAWFEYAYPYCLNRDPAHYKGDLMLWFGCWPVYAVHALFRFAWFLVHAPATFILSGMYRFFGRWLRSIADWQQKTFDKDLHK